MKVAMIDYGRGNLRSVERALEKAGAKVARVENGSGIDPDALVVLPGVGAFGDAVQGLKQRKLFEPLRDWVQAGRPFLGICLGFQLLWSESEEAPGVKGLGLMPGRVEKFRGKGLKIPMIGWSEAKVSVRAKDLFTGGDRYFYHVHSYRPTLVAPDWLACETEYGGRFPSGIWKGRVAGFQFHPEKSQDSGISLLSMVLEKIVPA